MLVFVSTDAMLAPDSFHGNDGPSSQSAACTKDRWMVDNFAEIWAQVGISFLI